MSPRPVALVVALCASLLSVDAYGDAVGAAPSPITGIELEATPSGTPPLAGYLRFRSGSSVQTDGGSNLRLPPGYFLDEENWLRLDTEVRRLQDSSTRLEAENRSLRNSLTGGWQPGWITLCLTLGAGIAGGYYLHERFVD